MLHPVHAHIDLRVWATLALAELIYSVFFGASGSRLAKAHIRLSNLSLPMMMISALAISGIVAALDTLMFASTSASI